MAEPNKVMAHATEALELLSSGAILTAPELAQELGIPRPSGYRLQRALIDANFAEEAADGGVRISRRWLNWGDHALNGISRRFDADDLLVGLRARTDLTVFLCVFRDDRAICIRQLHGENFHILALKIGGDLPPYLGAVGRLLLAYGVTDADSILADAPFEPLTPYTLTEAKALRTDIETSQARGYCVSDQDVTIGVAAVGVPVFSADGHALAALSVAGLRDDVIARESALVKLLKDTAATIGDRYKSSLMSQ